jgi:hypothetical protein
VEEDDYIIKRNSPYVLSKATDRGYVGQGREWYCEPLRLLVATEERGMGAQTAVKIMTQSSHQNPPPSNLSLEIHLKQTQVMASIPPVSPRIPMM